MVTMKRANTKPGGQRRDRKICAGGRKKTGIHVPPAASVPAGMKRGELTDMDALARRCCGLHR